MTKPQEIYEKALSISPGTPAIQNNYALSMILNDQIDEAIQQLEKLSARVEGSPTIRQNLALAYGLKGNSQRARELNLKGLSPEQAEENLQFYKHYAELKKRKKPSDLKDQLDAFSDEPTVKKSNNAPAASPLMKNAAPAAGKSRKAAKQEAPPSDDAAPEAQPQSEAQTSGSAFGNSAEYSFPSPARH